MKSKLQHKQNFQLFSLVSLFKRNWKAQKFECGALYTQGHTSAMDDFLSLLLFIWLFNYIISLSTPLSQSPLLFPTIGSFSRGVCVSGGWQRLNWASYHDKSLVNEESIVSPHIVSPYSSSSTTSSSSLCPLDRYLWVVKLTQIMNWPLWTVLTILTGCTQQMSRWQKATGKSTLG